MALFDNHAQFAEPRHTFFDCAFALPMQFFTPVFERFDDPKVAFIAMGKPGLALVRVNVVPVHDL